MSASSATSSELILASLGKGSPNCWGIADLTSASTELGFIGPGTLYFEEPEVGGSLTIPCEAGSFKFAAAHAGVKTSTAGFSSVH